MQKKFTYVSCLLAALALIVPIAAQEGHPLSGTWHGTWGPNAKERTDVTLVMEWDGKEITGLLNPGLESSKLQKAALDPSKWGVHFEADVKDKSGKMVHAVADGNIQDVTSIKRSIVGTWVQGGTKGDFKVIRDN